jgi:hypothetical protein
MRVLFHRVPEPKVGKNRVHLDVRVSAASEVSAKTRRRQVDAEAARLQTLGGIHLRTEEDEHDYFAVMTDPEGNEFCINRACLHTRQVFPGEAARYWQSPLRHPR